MVLKPLFNFARGSLGKTLIHGYPQSFVAGTQSFSPSSSPLLPFSHSSSKHGRAGTSQFQSSFHSASASTPAANKTDQGTVSSDKDLSAYYDVWRRREQRGGEEAKEWKQFQFTKRIGWNTPSVIPDVKANQWSDTTSRAEGVVERGSLERAYSTSAVDDIKKAEDEAVVVIKVDDAVAYGIASDQLSHQSTGAEQVPLTSDTAQDLTQAFPSDIDRSLTPSSSPAVTFETSQRSTPLSDVTTTATAQQDVATKAFLDHLCKLNEAQSYAEIPPVFESMVAQGIRPSANAYNALLASAIYLPTAKHQLVPKALSIYMDMRLRKVDPDSVFCNQLIQVLSQRALDVRDIKTNMDQRRKRYSTLQESRKFLFASDDAEYNIVAEDYALSKAIELFETSVLQHKDAVLSGETYGLLIAACAVSDRGDFAMRTYEHMRLHQIKPSAAIFPILMAERAKSADLARVIGLYNEYKSLVMKQDAGESAIIGREDNEVYAAVLKAYALWGKNDDAQRFFNHIISSYDNVTENREERLGMIQDTVALHALVQERLDADDCLSAFESAKNNTLSSKARDIAMVKICSHAADNDNAEIASQAFRWLSVAAQGSIEASSSLFALHIRKGEFEVAAQYWSNLTNTTSLGPLFVEPTAFYAMSLIRNGRMDDGLLLARETFSSIRASSQQTKMRGELLEQIDEAIQLIGEAIARDALRPSPKASLALLWAMVENGGLVPSVAEHLLAGLGPKQVAMLTWQDLILCLQIEAGFLVDGKTSHDIAHSVRFAHLFELAVGPGAPLDERTSSLINRAIISVAAESPNLHTKWQNYQQLIASQTNRQSSFTPILSPTVRSPPLYADNYDPYESTTDHRGSTIIVEELENHRNGAGLNEALMRFRNVRRAGRHPKYIAYAKLITAAAKENRISLTHDILGMARHDMPFLSDYSIVRHGWSTILDAMVGACLTAGRRTLAEQFHQELLDMGSTPTANTFGLYITTLKESTKTFDEATEAVTIFNRSVSEGVAPSSFLYNALIGKLGKARRIDDCLRYFQEMRTYGIRPTSVTYGTIVNALCRVSDERFAEELFDEMESMPNYKPRPAPYNSLMQFCLTTKRDSEKVLSYYQRMRTKNIQPTMHTYKLLIDTYATLEPVNLAAAEGVLDTIRASGNRPEAVHYASLIHAKGCTLRDMVGARQTFDKVLASGEVRPQACLYQALFESMVANHSVAQTEEILDSMSANRVEMTPYIANTLIHGWAMENIIAKSKAVYDSVGMEKREPSTYEAMTRAFLTVEDRESAMSIVHEMLSRGYPSAVSGKILELVSHGASRAGASLLSQSLV